MSSRLQTSLVQVIFNGTAKTKLAILALLYCSEFVKTPNTKHFTTKPTVLALLTKVRFLRVYCRMNSFPISIRPIFFKKIAL